MGRPKKLGMDYFSHDSDASDVSDTLVILESRYANDGYAFWFKLLEKLSSTENHYICTVNPNFCNGNRVYSMEWQVFVAKTHMDTKKADEILALLSEIDAIDKDLWLKNKIIWVQKLVNRFEDVYKKRNMPLPTKPVVSAPETPVSGEFPLQKPQFPLQIDPPPQITHDIHYIPPPESKVKESKVNNTLTGIVQEVYENLLSQKCLDNKNLENEIVKKVFEGLKVRRQVSSPAATAEAVAIRWMLKQGFTGQEMLDTYDKMKKQEFWSSKFLHMQKVKSQIIETKNKNKFTPHTPEQEGITIV